MNPYPIREFSGPYAFLSNFYEREMYYWDDQKALSAEHMYQSKKAITARDQIAILNSPSAVAAKHLGNRIKIRNDWDYIHTAVMLKILRRKFSEGDLMDKLLATEDREIIHMRKRPTPSTLFWGVVGREGKNMLGKMLMLIRAELKPGNFIGYCALDI